MKDAVLVRVVDGARDRGDKARGRAWLHELAGFFPERPAVRELHAVERMSFAFAGLVNWQDVRMIEARDGFRFRAKTFHHPGRSRLFCEDHFYRDLALRAVLDRAIDHAHPAARNLLDQIVTKTAALIGDIGER